MGITFNPFTGTLDFTGTGGGGGGGTPGAPVTSVQFNDGGGNFGGDADFTWNKTTNLIGFTSGSGLSFAGAMNPITMVGGDDGFGDTAIVFDNADTYAVFLLEQFFDFAAPNGMGLYTSHATLESQFQMFDTGFTIKAFAGNILLQALTGLVVDDTTIAESKTWTSAATGTAKQQIVATAIYDATDGSPTADGLKVISSQALVGSVAAAKGLITNYIGDMEVQRSGSVSNEYAVLHGNVSVQIGTGYTQSVGPVGGVWIIDDVLNGPIGVQPSKLNGHSILVNNYFNGSPSLTTSAALTITTSKLFGVDATHIAANSYPFDVALVITGTSNNGSPQIGWTTGIQVGGGGGSYGETITASKIGTGVHLRDYTTYGLLIDNPSGSPTASISADGLVIAGTFQPTSTYKSVDGTSGATGTDGGGSSFKNGLITTVGSGGGSGSDDLAFYCGQ